MLYVSPAEPKELYVLGRTSSLPEKYGVDFLFASEKLGLVGVQRKRFPDDFLSSLRGDDRVSRELQQMKQLDFGIWLLEGMGIWTTEGFCMYGGRYKYTLQELWGFKFSAGLMGYQVHQVRDMGETVKFITHLQQWAAKDEHVSLFRRSKPGKWGQAGSREWALHFLQGLPGIGFGLASKILDSFGKLPFVPDFDYEQMRDAVGPAKAKMLCEVFGIEFEIKVKVSTRGKDKG